MQKATARLQAEALAARLCRDGDGLVYELSMVRRDGKIVRTFVDAKSGQVIEQPPRKRGE